MSITNGTNITSIEKPAVGIDTGPGWATALNNSLDAIDNHDHTTNKGSRITTAALNINADLEFNENQLTEVKGVVLSTSNASSTNAAVYANSSGNLFWRNSSGVAVQITDGSSVKSGAGSIDNMGSDAGNQAGAAYSDTSKSFSFFEDQGNSDMGKMNHADLSLYKYSGDNSADTDYVILQTASSVSGAGGTITVPGETGTMLTSASVVSDISVTSTTASKPVFTLANNADDATSAILNLKNLRGGSNAGVANDDCGTIQFYGNDAANNNQVYAKVLAEVSDPTSGGEEGKLSLFVAEYDGTNTAGLILTGTDTDGEVDVTIGAGTASVTSIAGTLDLGDRAILNVGDIDCDSISIADAAIGLNIDFGGNTTKNLISLTDHLADALNITEGSNSYIKFNTTNSSEQIVFGQNSTFNGTTIADLGTVTTADINGGTWQGTIDGSWTAASQTCADLGSVTTCDINGGTINGITDLAVADGGTGSSTASGARTNLGVVNVPSNIVCYRASGESTPSGWSEYTTGRGRMIVGLPSGGTDGGTVGTAFTDAQDKSSTLSHYHAMGVDSQDSYISLQSDGGYGSSGTFTRDGYAGGATSTQASINNNITSSTSAGTVLTSNFLAYIQLMTIKKD